MTSGMVSGYAIAIYENYSGKGLEVIYSTEVFDLSGSFPGLAATKVGWQKEYSSGYVQYVNYTPSPEFEPLNGTHIVLNGYAYRNKIRLAVEYQRDTNAVISELVQAIISLGGNV